MVPADAPPEMIQRLEQPTPLTRECLDRVSRAYEVHPVILSLIARVEGGWTGAKIANKDGSYDLGLMQINTIHLEFLKTYGITEEMLRNTDCINLGFAAYYVRKVTTNQTAANAYEYLRAIARYHSKNEPHRTVYADKLMAEWENVSKVMNLGAE